MYKAMMKPFVVFGSETWVVAEMDMNRLGTGWRRMLRRVYGPVVEQGIRTGSRIEGGTRGLEF